MTEDPPVPGRAGEDPLKSSPDPEGQARQGQAVGKTKSKKDPVFANVIDQARNAPIWWTISVCGGAVVLGEILLWLVDLFNWQNGLSPAQVVGGVLAIVAIMSYGGFYIASRRARIAITSSFLLTFLVMLAFVLTVPAIDSGADKKPVQHPATSGRVTGAASNETAEQDYAHQLMGDFRWVVMTVIIAYFGSEAVVGGTKVLAAGKKADDLAAMRKIQRSDRDLVVPPPNDEEDS
ncbi:hypothetical protein [Streptomyces sp. NPDC005485]|uniref:hypothetical protein n=1 Tax=Streptomyces sp. NPDC005485 TaxID=3155591 RepID=UPI0033BFAFF1